MFELMTLAEGSGVDYSVFITAITTSFNGLVTNTLSMAAAILPIGISIFGVMMLISYAKKIFTKVAGGGR